MPWLLAGVAAVAWSFPITVPHRRLLAAEGSAARLSISMSLALIVAVPVPAQSNATLQGRVFDASLAVVGGATVTLRNDSTGFERAVATDDKGRYYIEGIPPSTYEVGAGAASEGGVAQSATRMST
jgi:hypothetical protein